MEGASGAVFRVEHQGVPAFYPSLLHIEQSLSNGRIIQLTGASYFEEISVHAHLSKPSPPAVWTRWHRARGGGKQPQHGGLGLPIV